MKLSGLLAAICLLLLALPTAASETVDVWPEGKMPGRGANEAEADRPSKGDNVRRITNVSKPTLTVFITPKTSAPAPAVIVCPGGGYSYVVHDKEGTEVAAWLNSFGVTALVLKYRVKLYHAALDAAKVTNEFLLYPTSGHGYGLRSDKDVRAWPQAALNWLHKIGVLKARPAATTATATLATPAVSST